MNRFIVLTLLSGLVFSTSAQAQEIANNAVCQLLKKGLTSNNVAYQPGVDAYGNAVVPADGVVNNHVAGEIVKIPLTIDLAEKVRRIQGMGAEIDAKMGMVEIHPNGKVSYNDQDWTKQVKALCGQSFKEVTVEVIEPPQNMKPTMIEPAAPASPVIETPQIEVLPNKLAVDATSARVIQPTMRKPMVSKPVEPIQPLIGTPKGKTVEAQSDIITGSEFKEYNE